MLRVKIKWWRLIGCLILGIVYALSNHLGLRAYPPEWRSYEAYSVLKSHYESHSTPKPPADITIIGLKPWQNSLTLLDVRKAEIKLADYLAKDGAQALIVDLDHSIASNEPGLDTKLAERLAKLPSIVGVDTHKLIPELKNAVLKKQKRCPLASRTVKLSTSEH
jgi:hypothetical protein